MTLLIRTIHVRVVHLMRSFLAFFQVHPTEASLQRLDADCESKDENPKFHGLKIDENPLHLQHICSIHTDFAV